MNDFYLNDAKRKFYDDALALIRNCENAEWHLDPGLDKHIDRINSNKTVRTMFSRRGKNRSGHGLESYLHICYSKEVEIQIRSEIEPKLKAEFESKPYTDLVVSYNPPRLQLKNPQAPPFFKYIEDENYWNIFHIKFELKGSFSDGHDNFWTILSESLSKLDGEAVLHS